MKKANEYFDIACEEFVNSKAFYDEPFFVAAIKRAQLEAISETIQRVADNTVLSKGKLAIIQQNLIKELDE